MTSNISRGLLESVRADRSNSNAAANRELARMYLAGVGGEQNLVRGRTELHVAARMGDRGAGWLLAIYLRTGKYGFPVNMEAAEYWRVRTGRRLYSDAQLNYLDSRDKQLAIERYDAWDTYWSRYSQSVEDCKGDHSEVQSHAKLLQVLEYLSYVMECISLDYLGEAKTELDRLIVQCREISDVGVIGASDQIVQQLQESYDALMRGDKRSAAGMLSGASRSLWKLLA